MKHFIKFALILYIVFTARNLYSQSHGWTVNPADYNYNGTVTAAVSHGTIEVTTGTLGAFVGGTCRGFANGALFPPTGKTVFIVMCYSNLVSGETLTFKYFDPSDNKYYDITETIEFVSDMTVGDAFNSYRLNVSTSTKIDDILSINDDLKLNLYPNPLDHFLNLEYSISKQTHVRLVIFDFYSRLIQILVDEEQKPDNYLIQWNSALNPAGMYIIKFQAGDKQKTQKVILGR
jgi:hypothetical protein